MNDASPPSPERVTAPELVWAFEFDGGGRGRAVDRLPDFEPVRETGFLWAHLDLVHADTRLWLSEMEPTFGAAVDAMLSQDSHPHVDWGGDVLWGVARDINREVDKPGEHSSDLRFVVGPRFLVTSRRRPMQSAHALKRKVETGAPYESSADLLEAMLGEIAEAIGRVASRTAEQLEEIEDRVLTGAVSDDRTLLLKVRREVARFSRLGASLHTVVSRFDQAHGVPSHCEGLTTRLGQRVASVTSDVHYLADHARLLNEEVGAQISAAANRHLFTLTVLTTLLLPPSLVTGYFGMNTKNLPFADSDFGTVYATVVALAAALCVYLIMRRNKMLGRTA